MEKPRCVMRGILEFNIGLMNVVGMKISTRILGKWKTSRGI